MTSLTLDHSKTADANLAVLQRRDSAVTSITATAAHVAMYEFECEAWKRKDVEGALFVVERYRTMRCRGGSLTTPVMLDILLLVHVHCAVVAVHRTIHLRI